MLNKFYPSPQPSPTRGEGDSLRGISGQNGRKHGITENTPSPLVGEGWGEGCIGKSSIISSCNKILVLCLRALIHAYRFVLSPLVGRACRFQPTCSAYALEALEKHGPWRGAWLVLKRLGRCHPVKLLGGRSGYDPVP